MATDTLANRLLVLTGKADLEQAQLFIDIATAEALAFTNREIVMAEMEMPILLYASSMWNAQGRGDVASYSEGAISVSYQSTEQAKMAFQTSLTPFRLMHVAREG